MAVTCVSFPKFISSLLFPHKKNSPACDSHNGFRYVAFSIEAEIVWSLKGTFHETI